MAILSIGNVDSLKSKEFRETANQLIDKAGRWTVWAVVVGGVCLICSVAILADIIDFATAITTVSSVLSLALGTEKAISYKQRKKDEVKDEEGPKTGRE